MTAIILKGQLPIYTLKRIYGKEPPFFLAKAPFYIMGRETSIPHNII
jgi:hypothetical protein